MKERVVSGKIEIRPEADRERGQNHTGQWKWAWFQSWNTGDWRIKHTTPHSERISEALGRILDLELHKMGSYNVLNIEEEKLRRKDILSWSLCFPTYVLQSIPHSSCRIVSTCKAGLLTPSCDVKKTKFAKAYKALRDPSCLFLPSFISFSNPSTLVSWLFNSSHGSFAVVLSTRQLFLKLFTCLALSHSLCLSLNITQKALDHFSSDKGPTYSISITFITHHNYLHFYCLSAS